MKVVSINNKDKTDEMREEQKESCLNILDEMKQRIESGEITEFVAASTNQTGEVQIHCAIKDYLGGIGLMDVGKYTLTNLIVSDYDWEE
jgi:hypothetical protein